MLFWMHALFFMLRVQGAGGSFPPPLRTNEEQDCLARMAQGDTAARDQLIEHNLRRSRTSSKNITQTHPNRMI